MKRPAIFLDRDGVINDVVLENGKPHPPAQMEDIFILPGVEQALLALKQQGCLLIVVTNQPDVARGLTTQSRVEKMNRHLMEMLPLDDIYTCFHDDEQLCDCRKPAPGLLLTAQRQYQIDLSRSLMVGDRWRDIAAGESAGVKTVWIDRGYNEQKPSTFDYKAESLIQAVPWIVEQLNKDERNEENHRVENQNIR